jgi:hypothetical protein
MNGLRFPSRDDLIRALRRMERSRSWRIAWDDDGGGSVVGYSGLVLPIPSPDCTDVLKEHRKTRELMVPTHRRTTLDPDTRRPIGPS